jgi:hypothetical protein
VATAVTTLYLIVSPGFGNQYLQWPVPSQLARPTRLTLPLQVVVGAYAAVFYLPLDIAHGAAWQDADNAMMFVSIAVGAFMIIALPWSRRVWHRPTLPPDDVTGGDTAVDSPVSDYADEVLTERTPDDRLTERTPDDSSV